MTKAEVRGLKDLLILATSQLLVAALTIGILVFPYYQFRAEMFARDARFLNELADDFHQHYDRWPLRNGGVWELAVYGYIDYKTDRTRYHRLYEKFHWNKKTLRFERK